jgi:pimeloyl-ACP methyl ester carboxylesterase
MILILFIILGLGTLFLYLKYNYFKVYKRVFQPDKLPADFQFNSTHSFEEIFLPVENGVEIHALHFKIGFPKGVVLYFHGNEGNINEYLNLADDFLIKGYNLFIIDYRGFGKSNGSIHKPDTLYEDGMFTYDYLTQIYNQENIIVYGKSWGSPIAAYVASKRLQQSLILECPPFNFYDILQCFYPWPISKLIKFDYSTEKWMSDIKSPVYFFHGVSDRIIPIECSRKLMKTVNVTTNLTVIQSSAHYTLRNHLEYQLQLEKILQFIQSDKKQSNQKPPLIIKPIYKIAN